MKSKTHILPLVGLLAATFLTTMGESKQLGVGDKLPAAILKTQDGAAFGLASAIAQKPAVLIIYRGGWCPYCSKHLSSLVEIEDALAKEGVQLLAISPDQPSKLAETADQHSDFHYTLLSDQDIEFLEALGIVFTVPEDRVSKYKNNYHIDLEAASGRTHHKLPHPAVYVVDTSGTIRFAHIDPNYKVRLDPDAILEAVRQLTHS